MQPLVTSSYVSVVTFHTNIPWREIQPGWCDIDRVTGIPFYNDREHKICCQVQPWFADWIVLVGFFPDKTQVISGRCQFDILDLSLISRKSVFIRNPCPLNFTVEQLGAFNQNRMSIILSLPVINVDLKLRCPTLRIEPGSQILNIYLPCLSAVCIGTEIRYRVIDRYVYRWSPGSVDCVADNKFIVRHVDLVSDSDRVTDIKCVSRVFITCRNKSLVAVQKGVWGHIGCEFTRNVSLHAFRTRTCGSEVVECRVSVRVDQFTVAERPIRCVELGYREAATSGKHCDASEIKSGHVEIIERV